ncbi:RNA polymerase sigma factor [Planctomycetota bacterium]
MTENHDQHLVKQALQGDIDAFTVLAERHYPALVATAHSILGDRHLAEDAAQEALARVCEQLDRLRNPERFGPWLCRIVRNVATDTLRRRSKLVVTASVPEAVQETACGPDLTRVRAIVRRLPSRLREVVYLRYYDDMSYERMADFLGVSCQAINGRLRRAKRLIKKEMRHWEELL